MNNEDYGYVVSAMKQFNLNTLGISTIIMSKKMSYSYVMCSRNSVMFASITLVGMVWIQLIIIRS